MKVRKAVIPAAGLGTRFLPITKSVPKELLPIMDRPMLQYVVEEAAEAGIEEVIIVTAPGKESIASYFQPRPELEQHLAETGTPEMVEKVRPRLQSGRRFLCNPGTAAGIGPRRFDGAGRGGG